MGDFRALLSDLRRAEHHFEKQLAGIRAALASLEVEILATAFRRRRRRRMSAEARAKISEAQKKRWATKNRAAARTRKRQ